MPESAIRPAEAARLEGAAREAEQIDLVALLVVLAQEAIAALDAAADAEADGADREGRARPSVDSVAMPTS